MFVCLFGCSNHGSTDAVDMFVEIDGVDVRTIYWLERLDAEQRHTFLKLAYPLFNFSSFTELGQISS